MITKQEILENFWEQFPQYEEMTPTYEDIRFEEEEIRSWNRDWITDIYDELKYIFDNNVFTLKDLEEIIKLK